MHASLIPAFQPGAALGSYHTTRKAHLTPRRKPCLSRTRISVIPTAAQSAPSPSPPSDSQSLLAELAPSSSPPLKIAAPRPHATKATIHVATARAITPMRRPREGLDTFSEEQPLPSQRRSDLMAPRSEGIWVFIPYMAASAVFLGISWIAKKRFVARQEQLVADFGEDIVLYGTTPDSKREIASEYKRKLGPGILRQALFASYLEALVTEKTIVPATIPDVGIVKRLLGLNDKRAVLAANKLAASLQDSPSLLGKLLFIAERIIAPDHLPSLSIVPLFPYSPATVSDLQRNMLERCFKEFVNEEMDLNAIEEPPQNAVVALRLDPVDAQTLYDSVIVERIKKKEAEAALEAAQAAEEALKPNAGELDYPARSGEPAKANVHAYQCGDCGYTLFPAAGREFKFYGDDFVCPACGAPKDKFVDVNAEE